MSEEIGLTRAECYIANVVKCRPPNNRDPAPKEIEACRPYLDEQIDLIDPAVIVTLGNFATKLLLETHARASARCAARSSSGAGPPSCPTYHPAYVLRAGRRGHGRDAGRPRAGQAPDGGGPRVSWPLSPDVSDSPEDTRALAGRLAGLCRPGDVVLLVGDLGAGKTVFAQGFAAALGVAGPVTSPTFALVRQYRCGAGSPVAHAHPRRRLPHRLAGRGGRPGPGRAGRGGRGGPRRVGRPGRTRLRRERARGHARHARSRGRARRDARIDDRRPRGAGPARADEVARGPRSACAGARRDERRTPQNIVAIETATETVGVAVRTAAGVEAELTLTGRRRHVETLTPALEHLLDTGRPGAAPTSSVVAVDVGPGLFTGLRVGVAAAKGLAQSLGIGVIGVTSLDILTAARRSRRHCGASCSPASMPAAARSSPSVHEVGRRGRVTGGASWPPGCSRPTELADGARRARRRAGARRRATARCATPRCWQAVAGVDVGAPGLSFPPPATLLDLASSTPGRGRDRQSSPAAVVPLYMREADAKSNFARADAGLRRCRTLSLRIEKLQRRDLRHVLRIESHGLPRALVGGGLQLRAGPAQGPPLPGRLGRRRAWRATSVS